LKYIAKSNTWFKSGTECKLIDYCGDAGGIFEGIHIIEDMIDAQNRNVKIGDEILDQELCQWDEFEEVEDV